MHQAGDGAVDLARARALLEDALRAGLIDPGRARAAHDVVARVAPGPARAAALAGLGLDPRVLAALVGQAPGASQGATRADVEPAPAPPPSALSSTARFRPPDGGAPEQDASGPRGAKPESPDGRPIVPARPASGLQRTHHTDASGSARLGSARLPGLNRYAPGTVVGPFTITRELGRGAMGVVLEARDASGRSVALKLMLDLTGSTAARRFAREAKALEALDHANVVRFVAASDEPPHPPWLAMEFVQGRDLKRVIEEGEALSARDAARLVADVASGIAHAHRRGLIHRDLKPANVLVRDDDGRAQVTDFGLARALDASRFTRTGSMVGTLAYMAPEQVEGKADVGPPADVWALGAILYHALTRRLPFEGDSPIAISGAIVQGSVTAPRKLDASIPRELEAVCLACLTKDPARRPSAAEVQAALRGGGMTRPRPTRVLPMLAITATTVVVAAGLVLVARRRAPATDATTTTDTTTESATAAAPWPAPPAGWSTRWRLGDAPPALEPAPLWADERTAAPLAAVRAGRREALSAAFLGEATPVEGGLVRVSYGDPARALRLELEDEGAFMSVGAAAGARVERDASRGDAVTLLAPNDASTARLWIGDARWLEPRVELDVREVEHEDQARVEVELGWGDRAAWKLSALGRTAEVKVGQAVAPLQLGERWTRLRLAPTARAGERVRIDGADPHLLDAACEGAALPAGPIAVTAYELRLGLAGLSLEGRPVTTDVPARALAPGETGPASRVAASFQVTDPDSPDRGGALVDLGGLRLEVDGARLVLARDHDVLLAAALFAPPRAGWLLLERNGDRVTALADLDGLRTTLSLLDPLPLAPGPAAWGSTGPSVRFERVEVDTGPADAARRAWDALDLADAVDAAAERPEERWRRGALRLARVSLGPPWCDPACVGPAGRARRVDAASAAADDLESAAAGLGGDARQDALARLVLARVVATDAPGAASAARRLLEVAGPDGAQAARARLDGVVRRQGAPALLARLAQGYCNVLDVATREAALEAALELVPEQEGTICAHLAANVRNRQPKPDPRTPSGRAAYDRALSLFERARRAGADPKLFEAWQADTCMDLGRTADALALWDRVVEHTPGSWWAWRQRGLCLTVLGRRVEALESAFGGLAAARTRRDLHAQLLELLEHDDTDAAPGLRAIGWVVLGEVIGDTSSSTRTKAGNLAARAGASDDDRQADLGAYALLRVGAPAAIRPGDRPTATLARARQGEAVDLRAAAQQDPLVRHLARLDPQLADAVR